jgi:hypothetical protein
MTVLGNGLAFARRGYAVLPLCWPLEHGGDGLACSCRRKRDCPSPAKHPIGKLAPNGLLSATTESGIIKHWFVYQAPDANYAVRTDAALLVLDIDPSHAGDETLRRLESKYGELPKTWRSITGSGGEHTLFDASGLDLRRGRARDVGFGDGVDVPNYIVGPGSRHICGRYYCWNVDHHPAETELARLPDWLIAKLTTQPVAEIAPAPKASADWLKITREPVSEYRDAACASLAGYLVRHLDPVVAFDILNWWNAANCRPPLDDTEVHRIWTRIVHKHAARVRAEHEAGHA